GEVDSPRYVRDLGPLVMVHASPDFGRDFEDSGIDWMLRQIDAAAPKPVFLVVHAAQAGAFSEDPDKGVHHERFAEVIGRPNLAAVISGLVLYLPFMRKHRFGTLRLERSARVKNLDYHNLLGAVTAAWVLVVGGTGVINTLDDQIFGHWRDTALADLVAGYEDAAVPAPSQMASLDAAVRQAVAAAPDMTLQFVAFPGGTFSTDRHYAIFLHGDTPVTETLITPVLVDAVTGEVAGLRQMPWYVKALGLSQPLHFGDYAGLPLKILWALLDLAAIAVLVTGLYLWAARTFGAARRRSPELQGVRA
ncbi:MAG: PepSY-associated TM helix domain-containing protein, partial [Oceanicaulis sp.]